MALTDIFTGNPQKEAAAQQRAYFDQLQSEQGARIGAAQTAGIGALQSGQTSALSAVQPGFAQGRTDIMNYMQPGLDELKSYTGAGAAALAGGQNAAVGSLMQGVQQAANAWQPVIGAAGTYGAERSQASQMSADAMGLNGPAGVARAQAAFQTGPGYQFELGEGLNSIARNANAAGMVASGNQLRESQTYGQGLANKEYGGWQDRLMGRESLYAPLELSGLTSAAGGQANAYLTGGTGAANIYTGTAGKLADLYGATGRTIPGIYTGAGTSLADLSSRGGLAESGIFTGTGSSTANLIGNLSGQQTQLAGQIAPNYAQSYEDAANAQTGGSANLWNFGLNAAKAATGFIPKFT